MSRFNQPPPMNFIEDHWIFDEYRKVFKHYTPPIFAQEQMLDRITDKAIWKATLYTWGMNDYKPSSVGKMMDYYEQQLRQRASSQVGKYRPEDFADVIYDEADLEPVLCKVCGGEWCTAHLADPCYQNPDRVTRTAT